MGWAGRLRAQQLWSLENYLDADDRLYSRLIGRRKTTNVKSILNG